MFLKTHLVDVDQCVQVSGSGEDLEEEPSHVRRRIREEVEGPDKEVEEDVLDVVLVSTTDALNIRVVVLHLGFGVAGHVLRVGKHLRKVSSQS